MQPKTSFARSARSRSLGAPESLFSRRDGRHAQHDSKKDNSYKSALQSASVVEMTQRIVPCVGNENMFLVYSGLQPSLVHILDTHFGRLYQVPNRDNFTDFNDHSPKQMFARMLDDGSVFFVVALNSAERPGIGARYFLAGTLNTVSGTVSAKIENTPYESCFLVPLREPRTFLAMRDATTMGKVLRSSQFVRFDEDGNVTFLKQLFMRVEDSALFHHATQNYYGYHTGLEVMCSSPPNISVYTTELDSTMQDMFKKPTVRHMGSAADLLRVTGPGVFRTIALPGDRVLMIGTNDAMNIVSALILHNWQAVCVPDQMQIPPGETFGYDYAVLSPRPDRHHLVFRQSDGNLAFLTFRVQGNTVRGDSVIQSLPFGEQYSPTDIQIAERHPPDHPQGVLVVLVRQNGGVVAQYNVQPARPTHYPAADAAARRRND